MSEVLSKKMQDWKSSLIKRKKFEKEKNADKQNKQSNPAKIIPSYLKIEKSLDKEN